MANGQRGRFGSGGQFQNPVAVVGPETQEGFVNTGGQEIPAEDFFIQPGPGNFGSGGQFENSLPTIPGRDQLGGGGGAGFGGAGASGPGIFGTTPQGEAAIFSGIAGLFAGLAEILGPNKQKEAVEELGRQRRMTKQTPAFTARDTEVARANFDRAGGLPQRGAKSPAELLADVENISQKIGVSGQLPISRSLSEVT